MKLGQTFRTSYKKVTHVIFDLNGTLINTDEVVLKHLHNIFTRYGKSLTSQEKSLYIKEQTTDTIASLFKKHSFPFSVKEFRREVIAGLKMDSLKLQPGAEKLVRHLHSKHVPLAIATNSRTDNCDNMTKHFPELISCIHHTVSASSDPEVKRDKPAPDVFLVCAARFKDKPSPEKVLVFEDSPIGAEAAVAAGMQVVIVPHPLVDTKLFKNTTLALKTLENFQPELFGLPKF